MIRELEHMICKFDMVNHMRLEEIRGYLNCVVMTYLLMIHHLMRLRMIIDVWCMVGRCISRWRRKEDIDDESSDWLSKLKTEYDISKHLDGGGKTRLIMDIKVLKRFVDDEEPPLRIIYYNNMSKSTLLSSKLSICMWYISTEKEWVVRAHTTCSGRIKTTGNIIYELINNSRMKHTYSMHLVLFPCLLPGSYRRRMTRRTYCYSKIDWDGIEYMDSPLTINRWWYPYVSLLVSTYYSQRNERNYWDSFDSLCSNSSCCRSQHQKRGIMWKYLQLARNVPSVWVILVP